MDAAVEFAKTSSCLVDLGENSEGRISSIEGSPLICLAFLKHDLTHFNQI